MARGYTATCSAEAGSPSQQKAQDLTSILAVSYQLAAHLASLVPMLAKGQRMLSEDKGWWDFFFFWQQPTCLRCSFIISLSHSGSLVPERQTTKPTFCMNSTTICPFASSIFYNIPFQPSKWVSYQYLRLSEYQTPKFSVLLFCREKGKHKGEKYFHTQMPAYSLRLGCPPP